jgi:type I restriction enzyme S subunit
MSSEWVQRCLGDLIDIRGGLAYKSQDIDRGDARLLGMGCVSFDKRFLDSGCRRYSGEHKSQHLSFPGDLVIATRQQSENMPILGFPAMIPESLRSEKVIVGTNLYKVENHSEYPNSYLYWLMRGDQYREHVKSRATGSTVRMITKDVVLDFDFYCPSIQESKDIARFLDLIDDKIELNRKTNETLEAMAKALFKSWFVDFDPVRAKAEDRPTGLPAEISELFPDSFEDSELGEIPKGWTIQSAGKQYEVSIGKTPPRKEPQWFSTSNDDMPWLSIRDLGEVGVYADRTSERLTREAVEKFNVKIVPPDTAVLSFKLTIGRVAITWGEMLTNEAIAHFSPLTNGVGSEYTYCLLSQYDYHSLGSTSSIATAVNSQILRDMPLVVPPGTIARAFCDATASIFSSLKCAQQETHCLSDFRDTLLPKLISGEIRIPDAEKMLEEVGI